ncbi:MAG TPA: TolC family protein [Bryobacteraceae bacterium]|nr:TolC family protein [Bryobacteraceae bacterium]
MRRFKDFLEPGRYGWLLVMATWGSNAFAQPHSYTWQEIRDRFQTSNPTLRAAAISIDESRAQEITAYLRPNPDFSELVDGTQIAPHDGVWQPFSGTEYQSSLSYLHERRHKRELRRESAQQGTGIATSQYADQERTLLFNLRSAFVQTLQQKAVLDLARDNLTYYNHLLEVSQDRLKAGDIARVDYQRLNLQRAQYQSDVQTAIVNLRTAKIQLLTLLNDRTPVEQFDVTGPFDYSAQIPGLEELRRQAMTDRPDLKAAMQAVEKAQTDHLLAVANGSTDPTFSLWWTHNPSFSNPYAYDTVGGSVSIPLRIFDRNQGEKLRTQEDITRNERLRDAASAQVFSDVDSAYATIESTLALLQPYKETYLKEAVEVRDTVSFAYTRGGSSLLDFLQAQQDYRSTELNYLNLVGSYLTAAAQLDMAVGQEVIP